MLKVDLGELARKKRIQIDASVPAASALVADAGFRLVGPLHVQLDVQQAMNDIVARGWLRGEAEQTCRRCLVPVTVPVDEEVTWVFREGITQVEAEEQEIYSLPERGSHLDLSNALREHLLLAVPEFVECREDCKGLCPHCGVNLNETTCSCETSQTDNRWAALKQLTNKD